MQVRDNSTSILDRDKAPKEFKETWKDAFLRLILKDKIGKQHCLSFVGFNLGVDVFSKKSENQKKRARIEASLYAL